MQFRGRLDGVVEAVRRLELEQGGDGQNAGMAEGERGICDADLRESDPVGGYRQRLRRVDRGLESIGQQQAEGGVDGFGG